MKFQVLKYAAVYITPLAVAFSLSRTDAWSFTAVGLLFGLIPLLELLMQGSPKNLSEAEEALAKEDPWYDYLLYGLVPVQYLLLVYFLVQVGQEEVSLLAKIGMTMSLGMACGVLGINAAHELGHRKSKHEQAMSKLLLLSTLYMHFFIEHNRGHHKNVSTPEDPASSRWGESLYSFFIRTLTGSWVSAWHLEKKRLQKASKSTLSWENQMLRFQLYQLVLVGGIFLYFGAQVLLFFFGAALVGILLLETVNYIEHYGLARKKSGDRYERTLPIHSWNSNHPLGRLLLLELSRHSDHHYLASRKYQVLRHFDESPQMPTGYPGMMILAFFPPLWFKVMHRTIRSYKATQQGEALA